MAFRSDRELRTKMRTPRTRQYTSTTQALLLRTFEGEAEIPEDAIITGVHMDSTRGFVTFLVHSEGFEETLEGQEALEVVRLREPKLF